MKRDIEFTRQLMLQVEQDDRFNGSGGYGAESFDPVGHSPEEVAFHLVLLLDAGLLNGTVTYDVPVVTRLTWSGCEFLANTRDPEIWKTVKAKAEAITGAGLAMLGRLAEAEVKKRLGLH
jgi:hypothetical protein